MIEKFEIRYYPVPPFQKKKTDFHATYSDIPEYSPGCSNYSMKPWLSYSLNVFLP